MTEIQLNMYHALALGAAMYALGLVPATPCEITVA